MNLFGDKLLGFGMMRLPMLDGRVDTEQTSAMVDEFMAQGFCYFDTAHGYLDGKSELAVRSCVVARYPRDRFILTDKLTHEFFHTREEIRPLFAAQLEACGVDYFDFYLLHSVTASDLPVFERCHAFEEVAALKAEGRIRHIGMSFHDKPALLEDILLRHPEIEVVQIQFNYMDYEDACVQSRLVYETCRRFNKPVIVMEPVKGGRLAALPPEAEQVLAQLHGGSPASYAIRFAASFEGVGMVLSGMSTLAQATDNIRYMKDFRPLCEEEHQALERVSEILKKQNAIPCTACRYCVAGCPQKIRIPDLFACMNAKAIYKDWNSSFHYRVHTSAGHGRAADCISCRRCVDICPQHLDIPALLKEVSAAFDRE